MTTTTDFRAIAPTAPDVEALSGRYAVLRRSLAQAPDADACVAAVLEWDDLRRTLDTWQAHVGLRFDQDTSDAEAKTAREHRDAIAPALTELDVEVMRALLEHPLRPELEARLGRQAFALWEVGVLAFDPKIKEDLVEESKLEAQYTELLASASFEYRGEELNLSTLVKYRQHADREVRHGAERELWAWFARHGTTLDRIFDDLVRLRTQMACELGFPSFVELGYKRMSRVDYDERDVARFRRAVRDEVVPLAAELTRRQAEALGVDELMSWDEWVQDPRGNPTPLGDHDWMIERAREMFDEMGSGLGEFFHRMHEGGFLDLKSRSGKVGGGFCTSFPSHAMPFVFANFNGTKSDVEVFTHEMGHAFQCFSSRGQRPIEYLWPTMESCEIHSMSLEFLTWPHMEKFFGEGADRFRRLHLTDGLLFLPYGTAVDHFQHELYAQPDMTPRERHEAWLAMERTYLPWRRWGDLEYPARGGRWQHQQHVYLNPFYYIDYVLAQTCAMQFWVRAERDREETMRAYVTLCERGGEAPFQELARSAGLKSPFDEGCLTEVVAEARRVLAAERDGPHSRR